MINMEFDKTCYFCKITHCFVRKILSINLNCGSSIKNELYVQIANKCVEYKEK